VKFIKVTNQIRNISSREVEFENPAAGRGAVTFLRRIHNKQTIWKLLADGVYVHKEFARAYKLETV
jgi:hypothetical protein